jgi:hypothetical protein
MTKLLLLAAALALFAPAAYAASSPAPKGPPPTAAQKALFMKLCLKNSGDNTTLCTCKQAQLDKLLDTQFMDVVLASMGGKVTPVQDTMPYAVYISKSNAVCAPGM